MPNTLKVLQDQVMAMLQVSLNQRDSFQGEPQQDLDELLNTTFLRAANNARLWAERQHDFSFMDDAIKHDVFSGVPMKWNDFSDSIYNSAILIRLKTINQVYVKVGDNYQPIRTISRKLAARRMRDSLDLRQVLDDDYRYLADGEKPTYLYQMAVVHGDWLEFVPKYEGEIRIDGNKWAEDWAGLDDDGGPWLTFGFDFLQWQVILELNHMLQVFVPREEGSLAPPEKMRDYAWQNFIEWDSAHADSNLQPDI